MKARELGLDYGEKRIGIAISDPLYIIAQSLGYVANTKMKQIAEQIQKYCMDYEVCKIVVGLPLGLDGNDTMQTQKTRAFMKVLETYIAIPWVFHDESFTSRDATEALIATGVSRKKRKQKIDGLAAQLMLQSFMDSNKGGLS